jgi:hypothetical protein
MQRADRHFERVNDNQLVYRITTARESAAKSLTKTFHFYDNNSRYKSFAPRRTEGP